ncbi:MAG: Uma2 family endonuclease, partial [Bacteroidota bacterium]
LSKSTKSKDRGVKFDDYAAHGIAEYWLIDPKKEIVEKYSLPNKSTEYLLDGKFNVEEEISSNTLEGFKIPVKAIFDEVVFFETLSKIVQE